MFNIYFNELKDNNYPPLTTDLLLSNVSVPFQIDTGASVSIINDETLETLKKKGIYEIKYFYGKLQTYSGQYIIPMGEIKVKVTYEKKSEHCLIEKR